MSNPYAAPPNDYPSNKPGLKAPAPADAVWPFIAIHVVMWICLSIMLLGISFFIYDWRNSPLPLRFALPQYVSPVLNAAAIAGVAAWVAQLIFTTRRTFSLGQALLISMAVTAVVSTMFAVMIKTQAADRGPETIYLLYAMQHAISACLAIALAIACFKQLRWMAFFALEVIRFMVQSGLFIAASVTYRAGPEAITVRAQTIFILTTLSVLVLAAVVVLDVIKKAPRDYFYYVALGLLVAFYLLRMAPLVLR
jgi:hypothetical protein